MHTTHPARRLLIPGLLSTLLMFGASFSAAAQDDGPPPPGAFAGHDGPRGHGPHEGGPMLHLLRQLDLSDSQRETIKSDVKRFHEQGRASFEAMRSVHRAFQTTPPDSASYSAAVTQMADAAANMAREHVQREAALRKQIYAVLTDAQKSKLNSLIAALPEPPAPPAQPAPPK